MNIWDELPKPFLVLAPMDDVTETVFRRVVGGCAPPDLYFTEFVNVDSLQSKGREATLRRLQFTEKERPIIAQIWGLNPENFYKTAIELTEMGFDGVDLNFGCPEKRVVKNGACSALMLPENEDRAIELIQATREGLNAAAKQGRGESPAPLPLSVKTRLGFKEIDMRFQEAILKQKLNALSIHGRTRNQMSKVPADWGAIGQISKLRDELSPATKLVGNGDVMSRMQGEELAKKYNLDGIMIGRGVFHDPFVFAKDSPWENYSKKQKISLYRRHVELFTETYGQEDSNSAMVPKIHTLNKFCKIYINNFDGAKELRDKLMHASSAEDLISILSSI